MSKKFIGHGGQTQVREGDCCPLQSVLIKGSHSRHSRQGSLANGPRASTVLIIEPGPFADGVFARGGLIADPGAIRCCRLVTAEF